MCACEICQSRKMFVHITQTFTQYSITHLPMFSVNKKLTHQVDSDLDNSRNSSGEKCNFMKVTGMFLFIKGKYERSLSQSKVLGYSRVGEKWQKIKLE